MVSHLDSRLVANRNEATTLTTLSTQNLGMTDTEFAAGLLETESVAVVPGSLFFKGTSTHPVDQIRIAPGRPFPVIESAVQRMNSYVSRRLGPRSSSAIVDPSTRLDEIVDMLNLDEIPVSGSP